MSNDDVTDVTTVVAFNEAWRGFFDAFPDYRNIFDEIDVDATGAVQIRGRSECSTPALHGPARWHAQVRDDLVLLWHVTDATPP